MHTKHRLVARVYDRQNRLLATGTNSYDKTHPAQAMFAKRAGLPEKQFLHAEVRAIIRALKKGKPHSISIERYGKDGQPLLAKPCPVCALAIKESGIKEIYHT
jgi:tRNA(Arg) A34 adenosine deaminase TadA